MADGTLVQLEWDSEFWGETAALIRLDDEHASPAGVGEIIGRAQREFEFVQMLVPAGRIEVAQVAERRGFLLVDTRCEVVLEASDGRQGWMPDRSIRNVRDSELGDVAELASTRHGATRFGSDPSLDPERCREFYRRWIRRDATLSDWAIAVAEVDGRLAGYVSFGPSGNGAGTIGLIGVTPSCSGVGLGRRLVSHATGVLLGAGHPRISVMTQAGSQPAMRMYRSCGFAVERLDYWFHWHSAAGRREQF